MWIKQDVAPTESWVKVTGRDRGRTFGLCMVVERGAL